MGSFSVSSMSGTVFHHTFRILAEAPNTQGPDTPNLSAKFNPSMAIIIIVLISAFLFLGFFSIYLRRCTSAEDHRNLNAAQQARAAGVGPMPVGSPGQGLDREVVESLPLVGYNLVKDLKGGKELTECAVCLSDFEDDDDLRLLPKCGHVFHPDCIDMWFHSHSTCPLCRTTVMPVTGEGKSDATYSEEFQAWVNSRGGGSEDPEAVTIHDGPPVPPNGSILELLSREGADRIMAESLRRDGNSERLDSGLARREGDENGERALEIRALNRALSKNSESFRKASRGVDVSERIGSARFHAADRTSSARFNRSDIGSARFNSLPSGVDGTAGVGMGRKGKKSASRSGEVGQSINAAALRRSSSVGSSGRFIRQLLGNYAGYFSPDSQQDGLRVDRARLLSARQHPSEGENLTRSGSVHIPVWDQIELNGEAGVGASQFPKDGSTLRHSVADFRKSKSQDWPRSSVFNQPDSQDESSGPLYTTRNGKQNLEERTKSERLTLGQSLKRTFSLRRTFSDSRDSPRDLESGFPLPNESPVGAKWYSHMVPPTSSSSSKVKKFASPWVAAMKVRRKSPSQDEVSMSPRGGMSDTSFPQSLPIHEDRPMPMPPSPSSQRTRPILDDDRERQLQERLRNQSTGDLPSERKETHVNPISTPASTKSSERQEVPSSPRAGELETPPTSLSSHTESVQVITES